MDLHYALYHSKSLQPASAALHNDILQVSARNNARDHLTGFLHREADYFIQYIEGPKTRLYNALARIGRDTRHSNFEVIQNGPAEKRLLPDWKMGFVDPGLMNLSELLDVSDGRLDIRAIDPFDLVIFLVSNAGALRAGATAA